MIVEIAQRWRASTTEATLVNIHQILHRYPSLNVSSYARRYLEARNWNVNKSKKMLEETLKWRSTYKPEEIRWVT